MKQKSNYLAGNYGFFYNFFFYYLVLYFLFISNFFVYYFPLLKHIHQPFQYISSLFLQLVNLLFIHRSFDENLTLDDNYWLYVAVAAFGVMALIIALVTRLTARGKPSTTLVYYFQFYCRIYLALVLFVYGFSKLMGNQFTQPSPGILFKPVGSLDPHSLMWAFMGASESYSFFGGMLEVVAGCLLLFRRTMMVGVLIALATIMNVLVMDIGYDTLVKVFALHLLLIGGYLLLPFASAILSFLLFSKNTSPLKEGEPVRKPLWLRITLFVLVAYASFVIIYYQYSRMKERSVASTSPLEGIYRVTGFNSSSVKPTPGWQQLAIDGSYLTVKFFNDSFSVYKMNTGTSGKQLELKGLQDPSERARLLWTSTPQGQVVFSGIINQDSVSFSGVKTEISTLPLVKNRRKIQWVW